MPSKKAKPTRKVAAKSAAKRSAKPAKSAKSAKPRAKAPAKPAKVKAIPAGYTAVTPHLICGGAADAIEFYKKAFGAVEEGRMPGSDGKIMHAAIRIGGSPIMLVDEMPQWGVLGPKALNGSTVTIHLYVEDVDAVFARAVEAGAKVEMPVADMFWGDRYGKLEDPFGHHWSVATHTRDLTPQEIMAAGEKAMAEMGPPPSTPS